MAYLTVSISAKDLESAKKAIVNAKGLGAEMLELRLDSLEELSVENAMRVVGAAKKSGLGLIATCRDSREGGAGAWDEILRVKILLAALEAGAEHIDCEFLNFEVPWIRSEISSALKMHKGARLILSAHNFDGPFDDMKGLYGRIRRIYPDCVVKIAYKANHINDCFECFDLLHERDGDAIILAMGRAGVITRILAKKLGSYVGFASLVSGDGTAPGQLSIDELRKIYRWGAMGSGTGICGIIASPVEHSMSPVVHNRCFDHEKLDKVYVPLLVDGGKSEFYVFMENVLSRGWLGFEGFSVTLPHKENALEFVKDSGGEVEELAERIGAVNTLVIAGGGKVDGYNTDYKGAMDPIEDVLLRRGESFEGLKAGVIGAGGAARAVVAGLCGAGGDVTIYNRTVERAEKLAAEFGCSYAGLDEFGAGGVRLVVNCTSVGMSPKVDASAVKGKYLKEGMIVFDTVYNPVETKLLRMAREAGCEVIDGVSMFVGQGMAQFELFTGIETDSELMRRTIFDCLLKKTGL